MNDLKQELMNNLKLAVDRYNETRDPNDAVFYAAKKAGFNLDQTERLTELFNSARTLYHYETASDRSSEFPLAKKADVFSRFNETRKEKSAEAVSDKTFYFNYPTTEKAATSGSNYSVELNNLSGEGLAYAIRKQYHRDKVFIKDLKKTASSCNCAADLEFKKAAEFLKKGGTKNLRRKIEKMVLLTDTNELLNKYAVDVLELIPEHMLPKEGSLKTLAIDDSELKPLYQHLETADSFIQDYAIFKSASQRFEKELEDSEAQIFDTIYGNSKGAKETIDDFFTPEILKQAQYRGGWDERATEIKRADIERERYQRELEKAQREREKHKKEMEILNMKRRDRVKDMTSSLFKPVMDQKVEDIPGLFRLKEQSKADKAKKKLDNVRRELILSDLITNDPVLATEDPENIARAYEVLWDLAPDSALNKSVARSFIRQAVNSEALDTFTAKQLVEMEEKLKKTRGYTMPGNMKDYK